MKIARIAILLFSLSVLPGLVLADDLGRVRLGLVTGDVQVSSEDTGEWFPASVNTPLREGDRLWVPDGARSELQILGGIFIRLDEVTSFDILSMGDNFFQFFLQEGSAYINNGRFNGGHIQIDTPLSSISFSDDSVVMIDVTGDGSTELSVVKGYAHAETRDGKIRVLAGNTLVVGENAAAAIYPIRSPDAWEEWNRERDGWLAESRESDRYLPNELDVYVSDFDRNGRWLYAADYGYVWTPSVAVSVDWAPYRKGRWVWIGGHFVWVSYEPWGWVPYHYGRWAFVNRVGWCWVPPRHGAVYWAPGYVGWVHTPTYVSWVPLAPGEIYYAYGNYGPGSVNITNVTINKIVIQRNFKHLNVRNAVTVVHRDRFIHGKQGDFRLKENPFKQKKVNFGPPRDWRDKALMSPVIRKAPAAKLPPPRVKNVNPNLLRKDRKVVTDERGSVFNPGRPVRKLPTVRRDAPIKSIRDREPARIGDTRQKPIREDASGKERRMPQRDIRGPFGTDRPYTGGDKAPAVSPAPRQRPALPAAEPRPGGRRDDIRRQTQPSAPVAPSGALPSKSPSVRPEPEKAPRVYTPKRIETPKAPQPVAPTPVWRPQRTEKPQSVVPARREPAVQPARTYRQPAVVSPSESPRVIQPRRETQQEQRQIRQPVVKQEKIQKKVRQQAAPEAKAESRRQDGSREGAGSSPPYRGERGDSGR